jgi:UDP-N-acetylmuramate: L-alanyl-gamma-D-glutamyl-meso-diaminopimelate ligase
MRPLHCLPAKHSFHVETEASFSPLPDLSKKVWTGAARIFILKRSQQLPLVRGKMLNKEIKRVYFIGICGSAMANLAVKMKAMGYRVGGSDENIYPPMSTFLAENGIVVLEGFREENIAGDPDLVVIGNAVSRGNPEAEYTLENKLRYISLPEALKRFFLHDKQNIVVAGTHGKTTSTSLLAWVLESASRDPSFLIGGIPINFGHGFKLGKGGHFVLEGDEYDSAFFDKRSKFVHYLPDIVIINNIEFDHCDIFRDLDDILLSFRGLINLIPRTGLLVANGDDGDIRALVEKSYAPVETFGFRSDVKWQITNLKNLSNGVKFDLHQDGSMFGNFFVPLAGDHNTMNTAGAVIVMSHLGLEPDEIQKGLASFKNIRRRMEIRGEVNGITVYDDFAHHPTEVRETLEGIYYRYPAKRIWAVFEPRTNTTRRNVFQKEIPAAFDRAHGVAIGRINRASLISEEERLDREQIMADLAMRNKKAFYDDSVEQIIEWLLPQLQPGDQVVIMSNGSFDHIHEKLLIRLRQQNPG